MEVVLKVDSNLSIKLNYIEYLVFFFKFTDIPVLFHFPIKKTDSLVSWLFGLIPGKSLLSTKAVFFRFVTPSCFIQWIFCVNDLRIVVNTKTCI